MGHPFAHISFATFERERERQRVRDREISKTHWSYYSTYLEYRFFLPPFQNSLIWSAWIASNLELIERWDLELLHSCWAISLSLSLSHELATSYMGIINTVSFFLSPLVLSCSYVQAAIMKKLLGLPFLLQHTIYIYIYLLKIDFILKEIIVVSELLFHWLIGFF
jgi:hypothetical protein